MTRGPYKKYSEEEKLAAVEEVWIVNNLDKQGIRRKVCIKKI